MAALVDAKKKLDIATRVLHVLDHTQDSMVSDAERAECLRLVGDTREVFDELVDSLSAQDRWTFVLQLMLADALNDED